MIHEVTSPDPTTNGGTMQAMSLDNRSIIRTNAYRIFFVTSLAVWDLAVVIFVILGFNQILGLQAILIGILIMIVGCLFAGGLFALAYLTWKEWDQPPLKKIKRAESA